MEAKKEINIHTHLDPFMETAGLLFLLANKDGYKQEWIADHNELGLNGELFYEKYLGYIEQYLSEFEKYAVIPESGSIFLSSKEGRANMFFNVMFYAIHVNREWLTDLSTVSEEGLLEEVLRLLALKLDKPADDVTFFKFRTTEKFISFLDECDFNASDKWMLLQIYCQPKLIFGQWIELINNNLTAYEKAFKVVEPTFRNLLEGYKTSVESQKLSAYRNLIEGIHDSLDVYPTLIFPDSMSLFKQNLFYGLLLDKIPLQADDPEEVRDYLILRLKALADSSKMQIMQLLKQGDKYNLEIAEQLGVTAATTSHHMNVLLATGLVGIDKQHGKVYYHIEKDGIKQFIEKLEQYLL